MADEEQELIEEARKSREETEELREESGLDRKSESEAEPTPTPEKEETLDSPPEPWAKTSSGDADEITDERG